MAASPRIRLMSVGGLRVGRGGLEVQVRDALVPLPVCVAGGCRFRLRAGIKSRFGPLAGAGGGGYA